MKEACLDENAVAELLSGSMTDAQRARVEAHLDGCDPCRSLVVDLASLGDHPEEPQPQPQPNRVDHFELGELIGRGGMGDVYAAVDTKLGRKVALKMVRPQLLTSDEAIARFQREAQATAKFSHPNIVTIHFVGEHDGRPYVALEFLEGETLRDRLDSGPVAVDEARRIALAVTEALREAHKHGVLHRDLKPDNIHLDRDGRVRVLDFGLAKMVASDEPTFDRLELPERGDVFETRASSTAGTPTCMAPEQWRREPGTEATDVWALGVVLFRLLTGERPFVGVTIPELEVEVLSDAPAPSVRGHAPAVPTPLVELVAGCLAKAPQDRPSTAAIAGVLRDGEPARASKTSRWVATGVGAALALGLVAAIFALEPDAPAAPRVDVEPAPVATDRAPSSDAPTSAPASRAAEPPDPSPGPDPAARETPPPLDDPSAAGVQSPAPAKRPSSSGPAVRRSRPKKRSSTKRKDPFGVRE